MTAKAKELAQQITDLVNEFENWSPPLSGKIEVVDSTGDSNPVGWNLHLDEDDIKIVIETGINAIYIDHHELMAMIAASDFFNTLEPNQRKLLMSILEREE